MVKVLILSCIAFFLITGCFSNDAEVRKTELLAFSSSSFDQVAGTMHDRGWADSKEGYVVTFSESKREKGDDQDYYQFHLKAPGTFLVAMNSGADYESLFALIDSSKIDCPECKGCKNDTSYYRISPECYVCKEGFSYDRKRYILRVSRDGNFTFPKSPSTKPAPPPPIPPPIPKPWDKRFIPRPPPPKSFGENEGKKSGVATEAREADGG